LAQASATHRRVGIGEGAGDDDFIMGDRTSPPRWPQVVHTNSGSRSDG